MCNYIGEVRPSEAGRLGNAIYQSLVQNVCLFILARFVNPKDLCLKVDRWPWAKTHTWSGWREHYKAHMEEFNHQIRKMQKEKGTRLIERDASPR